MKPPASSRGEQQEGEQHEPVVGGAALGDRLQREPARHALLGQARLEPEAGHDRPQQIDDRGREDPEEQAQAGRHEQARARERVDLVRGGRLGAARPAEKRDPVEAHEAGRGQRERGACRGNQEPQDRLGQVGAREDRLEQEPFRDEAVQGRECRDRGRAHEHRRARPRQAVDQPVEPLEIARAGGVQHRAGTTEEERLEDRVIEGVQQRRGRGEGGGQMQPGGLEGERQAGRCGGDPDVLDRRPGEQPLAVPLDQRMDEGEHGAAGAEPDQHRAPPPERGAQEIEGET